MAGWLAVVACFRAAQWGEGNRIRFQDAVGQVCTGKQKNMLHLPTTIRSLTELNFA